jgi:hypothetical protein
MSLDYTLTGYRSENDKLKAKILSHYKNDSNIKLPDKMLRNVGEERDIKIESFRSSKMTMQQHYYHLDNLFSSRFKAEYFANIDNATATATATTRTTN